MPGLRPNIIRYTKTAHLSCDLVVHEEFINLLTNVSQNGYKWALSGKYTKDMPKKVYWLTEENSYFKLIYKENGKLMSYMTNIITDRKNVKEDNILEYSLESEFDKLHGITFKKNFGTTPHYYKRYVPGLFHYDNEDYFFTKVNHVGKVDFSSHFIACSMGRLPDANTAITVNGYVEPNEEYPFAFYPRSHNIAEYGVFNTRSWLRKWGRKTKAGLYAIPIWKDENDYSLEDDVTILMKSAQYTLDEQLLKLYNIKESFPKNSKEYKEAKVAMLKMVGKFEMNKEVYYKKRPYAHLAAIIKGRAIQRMINLTAKLNKSSIIQIIVDGLIYNNFEGIVLGDENVSLGGLKQENVDANGQFRLHNQYILEENGLFTKCHAGFDLNIESNNIDDWGVIDKSLFRQQVEAISSVEHLEGEQ